MKFNQIIAKESVIISYPSALRNTYEPGPDYILQPPLIIPEAIVEVKIIQGISYAPICSLRSKLKSKIRSRLRRSPENLGSDFGSSYLYDARGMSDSNMAHVIQHHLASLAFVQQQLGLTSEMIKVVLNQTASDMVYKIFQLLGYEVTFAESNVSGRIITVGSDDKSFFHLLPSLQYLQFDRWLDNTPKKIFISRRNTRRVRNETELQERLSHLGFQRLFFEDLSIVEQWSVTRNAREIVAIHGAALGTLAFKVCGGELDFNLVELFGSGFVVNPFRKYCAVISPLASWVGCRGRIEPSVVRDIDTKGFEKSHAFDSFEISTEGVEAALKIHIVSG